MCASSGAFFNGLEAFLKVALEKRYLEEFQKETNMVSPMPRITKKAKIFVLCILIVWLPMFAFAAGQVEATSQTTDAAEAGADQSKRWNSPADYQADTGNRITGYNEAPVLAARR